MGTDKDQNGCLLTLKLIGFVLCFAIPAIVLSLIFPSYAPWFVLIASLLLFVTAGFIVGLAWNYSEMTPEIRKQIKYAALGMFIIGPLVCTIWRTIRERDKLELFHSVEPILVIVAAIYIPFFLGRTFSRRNRTYLQNEIENGVENQKENDYV